MPKIKILKKLPKKNKKFEKIIDEKTKNKTLKTNQSKQFDAQTEKYLQFYDDIKISNKRYDW